MAHFWKLLPVLGNQGRNLDALDLTIGIYSFENEKSWKPGIEEEQACRGS